MLIDFETLCVLVLAATVLVWLAVEIRHSDRFGKDRGPMPIRWRHIFLWVCFISTLARVAWTLKHGTFVP